MARSKWLSAALAGIVLAGPMTQMTALAQAPPAPLPRVPAAPPTVIVPGPAVIVPAPPPAATPASSGVVTVPPSLAPLQSMQPEAVPEEDGPAPGVGAKIGAGVLNVVYVPGKAIICTAGTLVAGGFMLLTFGTAYREAASFFNEGCRGSWFLTPEQVAAAPKRTQFEY